MATTTWPAEIFVYSNNRWVSISPHGGSGSLTPATPTTLGGVKIGSGVNVTADGTISVSTFSGDYNDLTNKPVIPTQVNADWNSSGGFSLILNRPNLADVATSGSYSDLIDEPTKLSQFVNDINLVDAAGAAAAAPVQGLTAGANISLSGPTNGVYTISSTGAGGGGGVTEVKGTLPIKVANSTTTPLITVEAATTAASGVVKLADSTAVSAGTAGLVVDAAQLKAVNDSIPIVYQADWGASSGPTSILNKPTLSTVATTGDYGDLTNKPTLPTKVSDLTNDVPYCELDTNGKVPASRMPSTVDSIQEYPTKANFPPTGSTGVLYVDSSTGAVYRWSGSTYTEIVASPGSTDAVPEGSVNLYYTKARVTADAPVSSVAGRTGVVVLTTADISGLATVASSGSYSDLTNKPAVPAASTKTPAADTAAGAIGTSTSYARADHSHPLPSAADIGAAPTVHDHDITTLKNYVAPPSPSTQPAENLGTAGAAGSSTAYARADHVHKKPTAAELGAAAANHTHPATAITGLAAVATSGSYSDLSNQPNIPSKTSQLTNDSGYITLADVPADKVQSVAGRTGAVTLTAADIGGLANVATSGSYNDLSDQPTIPPAYTLPTANATVLGGVKVGTGLTMTGEVLSANVTTVPDASTTTKGIIQIADAANITAGTALRAVDAAGLKAVTDQQTKDFVNVSGDTMTGSLVIPDGTAAAPSLKFDDATGLYQPANNIIGFTTGGVERLRVQEDGVISIGTGYSTGSAQITVRPDQTKESILRIDSKLTRAGASYAFLIAPNIQHAGADYFHIQCTAAGGSLAPRNVAAFTIGDSFDNATGYVRAVVCSISENLHGQERYNIYASGTAPNYFAGQIRTTQGFEAAPEYSFRNDEDTGMYSPEANCVAFATSGKERLKVKGEGGVVFKPLAAAPASPAQGEVYFDSSTSKLRVYDGTTWADLH